MVAAVENMAFFGTTPWHRLGTPLDKDDLFDIDKSMVKAGMDWEVNVVPLYDADGRVVPAMGIQRETDKSILGVVSKRYVPLQNRKAFDWFQPFLDSKECALHTAGSLQGGQKIWVLAQIQRPNNVIVPGDEIAKFLLLSNSHDGKHAVRVGFTPIRVVCANTLAMAHGKNVSQLLRVRHSKQLHVNLTEIQDMVNMVDAEFNATADKLRYLTTRHINPADLRTYVKTVLGIEKTADKDLTTRTQNTINKIILLSIMGKGSHIDGIRGTYYGAYNGVTEYLSYRKGHTNNTRMDALWFGQNANVNKKALDLALTMAV